LDLRPLIRVLVDHYDEPQAILRTIQPYVSVIMTG